MLPHSVLSAVRVRTRSTARRAVVAGSLLACVATLGSVAAPSGAEDSEERSARATSPLFGFTVQVGPEERVFGPSGLTDFPYFSERTAGGKLIGFISNNDSYRVSTKNNKTIRDPKVIIKRGKPGQFDKCGAWLAGSVYKKPGTSKWYALYHAEGAGKGDNNRCIFNDDSVVASVGRAVSHDAGKTWQKTGQVLTQDKRFNGPKSEDATMGRLVQYGDFLYFFYAASTGNHGDELIRRLHVARSPVADLGAKGTWRKWHCYKPSLVEPRRCDFGGSGNAGLGGESTPLELIDPMARVIIPNTFLKHNVALYASGTRGFRLWVSNGPETEVPLDPADPSSDERAWAGSVEIYPPVSTQHDPLVDTWNRTPKAKQLYAYPSIVSVTGDSSTSGQEFYLYYVKLFPGGDFPERYLMRRKVTLSNDVSRLNRVALTTYYRKTDGRRRTSTERPIQNSFKANDQEGYLLAKPAAGYTQVIECAKKGDFILRKDKCLTGEKAYRRIGWISDSVGIETPTAIYRCFNRRKKNHFASTDSTCLGYKKEALLGYGLESL
ncbi:hypothetical protein [Nocardioides stalactiti]|uniref:hypothetical protein n=1 Tax=Nocardioides stalactiti TaxID=2755356 RepID=UPI00160491BD|nr:hypothetical protein [Nocardioides stalactiti]